MRETGHVGLKEPFAGLFTQGMVTHETYQSAGGQWLAPHEVQLTGEGEARSAALIGSGAPVKIGAIEKMSKSKKNIVDPDDIVAHYGADTARWFMLSDSPPERDVIWTSAGVEGAGRFVQRLWRMVNELADVSTPAGTRRPAELGEEAMALHRAAHKAAFAADRNLEALRFNVTVAGIYEFTNLLSAALAAKGNGQPDMRWALRQSAEFLVQMVGLMMPHLGEECWARLGYNTLLVDQPWPTIEEGLLVDDTITVAVQVNGKRRDELIVARDISAADLEAAALKLESVVRAIDGRPVRKVVVVPQRIVNVVA
jgi:leucyl-tRNA synthetase